MLGQNLFEAQNMLKRLTDTDLAAVAQQPSPMQFLAAAELSEREQMRAAYMKSAKQAGRQSVAERLTQGAMNQSVAGNIAANAAPMAPGLAAAAAPVPQGYAEGGLIRGYNGGGLIGGDAAPEDPRKPPTRQPTVTVTGRRPDEMQMPDYDAMYARMGMTADDIGAMFADADRRVRGNFAALPDRISPRLAQIEAQAARDAEALRRDKWLSLAQAGLAAAAGSSPNFLSNVAAGANVGLGSLGRAFEQGATRDTARTTRADALENARMQQEAEQVRAFNALVEGGTRAQTSALANAAQGAAQFETSERTGERQDRRSAAEIAAGLTRARINEAGANARAGAQLSFQRDELELRRQAEAAKLIREINERLDSGDPAYTAERAAEDRAVAMALLSGTSSAAQSIQAPVEPPAARLSESRMRQISQFVARNGDINSLPTAAERAYAMQILARMQEGTGRQ